MGASASIQFVSFQVHSVQYMVFVSDANSVHNSNYLKSLFSSFAYLIGFASILFSSFWGMGPSASVQFMNSSGPGTWILVGKLLVHLTLPEKVLWFQVTLPTIIKTKLLNSLRYQSGSLWYLRIIFRNVIIFSKER